MKPEGFEGKSGASYRVDGVKLSRKDKQLWVIIFDDGQWIRVFDEVAYHAGMKKGASLTTEMIEAALLENDHRMARYVGLSTLLRSSKTVAELRRKLLEKGYLSGSVEEALSYLKEKEFLDDGAYARHYAECRMDRESAAKISMGLMKRGVDKETVRQALAEVGATDEDVAFETAKAAGVKKLARLDAEEPRRKKEKLMAFLASRGYGYDVVKRVLRELLG